MYTLLNILKSYIQILSKANIHVMTDFSKPLAENKIL